MALLTSLRRRRILILLLFTFSLTTLFIRNLKLVPDVPTSTIIFNETLELAAFHAPRLPSTITHVNNRLPLDQLVDPHNNTIIGDVQFLLDFSIIGFGKCGTSTMMHWLAGHDEVQSFRKEVWDLVGSRPDKLIRRLYQDLPSGNYKRGYKVRSCPFLRIFPDSVFFFGSRGNCCPLFCDKSPGEITQGHVLDCYRTLFPKTKLIVGVRHPVRWFESLYSRFCFVISFQ
jgi:hypothetical protein